MHGKVPAGTLAADVQMSHCAPMPDRLRSETAVCAAPTLSQRNPRRAPWKNKTRAARRKRITTAAVAMARSTTDISSSKYTPSRRVFAGITRELSSVTTSRFQFTFVPFRGCLGSVRGFLKSRHECSNTTRAAARRTVDRCSLLTVPRKRNCHFCQNGGNRHGPSEFAPDLGLSLSS